MEVNGQLHFPAALPTEKEPQYPLYSRLGGPQSRSGRGGEEKHSQPPAGNRTLEPYANTKFCRHFESNTAL